MTRAELSAVYAGRLVMITGGLGFIGSHLARRLVQLGSRVLIVDSLIPGHGGSLENVADLRADLVVNISDIRDRHSLLHLVRGSELIFNLAGQTSHLDSMTDPGTDLDINCASQLALLETCREVNPDVRLVFAGTRQIYGRPEYLPVDEQHPIAPIDVNGINKAAGEWYHRLYGNVYDLEVTILRLTNTYGPGMRIADARQTFLGLWIRAVLEGGHFDVYGTGAQLRDFNYVDDVVEAFIVSGADPRAVGSVYNLGAAPPISLREIAELLTSVAGAGHYDLVPFPPEREAIDIGDYYADWSRILSELDWRPKIDLKEGLSRTLAFYAQDGLERWRR